MGWALEYPSWTRDWVLAWVPAQRWPGPTKNMSLAAAKIQISAHARWSGELPALCGCNECGAAVHTLNDYHAVWGLA